MSAIIGQWKPPSKAVAQWAIDWLHGLGGRHGGSSRKSLTKELLYVRKIYGTAHSLEYRRYLLWLGVYPSKRRGVLRGTDDPINHDSAFNPKST